MTCPWKNFVAELVQWALRLIVRRDVYGSYIPPDRRTDPKKVAFTEKAEPTEVILEAHFSGDKVIGLFTTDDQGLCRQAVVDIDRHGDEGSAEVNEKAATTVHDRAVKLGCSVLLENSNGRGGFKVRLIFSEPVPARWLRRLAKSLIQDWQDLGLVREPEVFPKQDALESGRKGNFDRLPGRHHTHDFWSRIWGGDRWLEGEDAGRMILTTIGSTAQVVPLEFRTEPDAASSPTAPKKPQGVQPSAAFIRMLRSALAAIPSTYFGEYQPWLRLGMCLRSLGDIGLELWDEVSRRCPKYSPGQCRAKWDSFDPLGKLTYRTILRLAKDNGWKQPGLKKGHLQPVSATNANPGASPPSRENPDPQGDGGSVDGLPRMSINSSSPGLPRDETTVGNLPIPPKSNVVSVPPSGPHPRPVIYWGNRPSDHVSDEAIAIYKTSDLPKIVFTKGGKLVRIVDTDSGPISEELEQDAMRGILARIADWHLWIGQDKAGNPIYKITPPHEFVVKDILSLPGWDPEVFPPLNGIIRAPCVAPDGSLIVRPGYHKASGLYYVPEDDLKVPPVSLDPSDDEIAAAVSLILDNLFFNFPFVSDADRANALGMLITPFVRSLILGPTPLMIIDAPVQGTGKGLLAECIVCPAVGELPATPPPPNDEEWSKLITSLLDASVPVVLFDNLTGVLRSASLAAALTTRKWSARKLGYSEMIRVLINLGWYATANNVELNDDLVRRSVYSRIDAKMEFPYERPREAFKHQDIRQWARDNRGRLIWAALTMVRAWISRGRPSGKEVMGSYESWVETIGGILQVCGVVGFLGNREKRRSASEADSVLFRAFCQAWFEKHGEAIVGGKDLYPLVDEKELLADLLVANTEQGRRNKLGRLIKKLVDRHFGPLKIVDRGSDNSGRGLYQLEVAKGGAQVNSGSQPTQAPNGRSPGTGTPRPTALPSSKLYDHTFDVDLASWSEPDAELACTLFSRQLEARWLHRIYLEDASAQIYDLCHAIYRCRSRWRLVTDLALVRFATTRGLMPGILTAVDEEVRIGQLSERFQEMNFFLDGLAEIWHFDTFEFEGRWIRRYAFRDLSEPDCELAHESSPWRTPWQSNDPLSRIPFDVTEYGEAGYYPHFVDLCRLLWDAGNLLLRVSDILEVVYSYNLLPGFGLPSGERDFDRFLTDYYHLELVLHAVRGVEFEGLMIEATTVSDDSGQYQEAFCLCPVGGDGTIPDPKTPDPRELRRRHLKPYRLGSRDAVRLLNV